MGDEMFKKGVKGNERKRREGKGGVGQRREWKGMELDWSVTFIYCYL